MKTRYYWLKIKNIFNKYTKKSYFFTKYRIKAQKTGCVPVSQEKLDSEDDDDSQSS